MHDWHVWLRRFALLTVPACSWMFACTTILNVEEIPPAGDYPLIIDASDLTCDAAVNLDPAAVCPAAERLACTVPIVIHCSQLANTIVPSCICPAHDGGGPLEGSGGSGGMSGHEDSSVSDDGGMSRSDAGGTPDGGSGCLPAGMGSGSAICDSGAEQKDVAVVPP